MKNAIIFFFMFFIPFVGVGQVEGRKTIEGKIIVPGEENLEGITIYNSSSNEGTISNKKGEFNLAVKVGDTLVFSAVQFKALMIKVDEASVDSGRMNVNISVGINELPEVVITPHDLTGDLVADIEKIKVEKPNIPILSSSEIMELDLHFPKDVRSKVENSAIEKKNMATGVNLLKILGAAVNIVASVFPDKKPDKIYLDVENPKDKLRNTYDDDFFMLHLKIKKKNINKFLYFIEDKGLSSRLLENGKELDLIEYLMDGAEEFKSLQNP